MGKLLDTYYLPNLNQKVSKNLNKSISSKNEAVIKILSTKNAQTQMESLMNSPKPVKNNSQQCS